RDDLVTILTEPKNSVVKQYKALFKMEGVNLEFEQEALETVADQAVKRGTGARGLRSIMENIMIDIMYDLDGSQKGTTITVTKDMLH
ncbi:MAG: ATP-dependent Clp protease ATP-binding subunit ClpX, partial [Lentisphaerae bacterium]|nr:ATP-dependent Clp protease ATP-binding subunit ClpX [Lentisphaerota bacterium]